ncbi:hypothetical protein [Bartonella tamiae]|nr:hypothetical protein [Bartonella tamiae]
MTLTASFQIDENGRDFQTEMSKNLPDPESLTDRENLHGKEVIRHVTN